MVILVVGREWCAETVSLEEGGEEVETFDATDDTLLRSRRSVKVSSSGGSSPAALVGKSA